MTNTPPSYVLPLRRLLFSGISAFLFTLLFFPGCTSPLPVTAAGSAYSLSRDGTIHYWLPAGWFEVTPDSIEADRAVWLVRDDYAGTLTVRRVHLRAVDRADLGGEGLLQVAKLTAALETSSKPGILAREPDRTQVNGRDAVSYDVEYSGSGDRTRTMLLESGGRVYAVTALVNGGAPPEAGREIFSVLQSFLAAMRM